ncbi:DUF1192 domain-containing protein [Marinivivus vitaminiproducens]|uniref:DUF1192 domain-containing protein n=1 Tax=Marinivivus vitaminiproducens TaxID=3035935 RepID=UPI0027AA1583|nr:DUF1192 domain-containing protein [Geminicoccaceae bacterium SCSIO 64248]
MAPPLDIDDDQPRNQPRQPRDLSRMSIDELRDYIAAMKTEIARVEQAIESKQSVRSAAEAFFKKP